MSLQNMSFHPIKRDKNDSIIGFASFRWDNDFQFTEIGVHKLLKPNRHLKIRLVYPENARPKGDIYKEILEEINAYVLANYKEHIK